MVVLSPTPLAKAHVIVERRAKLTPHDLILVDDGATEIDLAGAVQVLSAMRAQVGDNIPVDVHAVVNRFTPPPGWNGSPEGRQRRQLLHEVLRTRGLGEIAGHGQVRAFPVVVPVRAVRKRATDSTAR